MKVLVTGGAGFIGSHVCDALLKRGESVICVDNFNDYYNPNYKRDNIKDALQNPNYVLCEADICDYDKLKEIFEKHKPQKIIHLAARAGVRPSIQQPFLYEEVNIKGLLNMLELSKEHGILNFVFASSSSVYGNCKTVPFSESQNVDNPISPYAATKKAGELLCYTYHHLYKLNCSCLRFFTVYGPRGRPDMAPYKFTKLISLGKTIDMYGDGSSKRDYTFVLDIVSGILSALDKNYPYEIFNLGNSNTVSLSYFISVIEGLVGKKAVINRMPMQQGDVDITYANLTKAKDMLSYNPSTKIEEGMKKFYEWYFQNRMNDE